METLDFHLWLLINATPNLRHHQGIDSHLLTFEFPQLTKNIMNVKRRVLMNLIESKPKIEEKKELREGMLHLPVIIFCLHCDS